MFSGCKGDAKRMVLSDLQNSVNVDLQQSRIHLSGCVSCPVRLGADFSFQVLFLLTKSWSLARIRGSSSLGLISSHAYKILKPPRSPMKDSMAIS